MVSIELALSGIAGITLFLFAVVLSNYNSRIERAEKKADEIETNYKQQFKDVHSKLDMMVTNQNQMLIEIREQSLYCKMVQENKNK